MKKQSLVAVLLVMALFCTLAGCGGGNATPTEAPVSTPAATPEPTPEPTPAPTEAPAPVDSADDPAPSAGEDGAVG